MFSRKQVREQIEEAVVVIAAAVLFALVSDHYEARRREAEFARQVADYVKDAK